MSFSVFIKDVSDRFVTFPKISISLNLYHLIFSIVVVGSDYLIAFSNFSAVN